MRLEMKSAMSVCRNSRRAERGQVLILCALFMVILMLFVGLAIDFGMAYVTRAQLGKAADAAVLTAARNSNLGPTKATALANAAFAMNYNSNSLGYDASAPPAVNLAYSTDASGNTLVNINVTATNKTSFAGLLPAFNTVNVATSAQGMARRVIMTLVLDRTGSMGLPPGGDGGEAAIPGAVTDFITQFDDTYDSAALVSFAVDVTVNVPMRTGNFQQAIINAADAMKANGSTWSEGALAQALTTETAFTPPPGTNPKKVVVFMTDGLANTIKSTVTCKSGSQKSGTWIIGGQDSSGYSLFNSGNNTAVCSNANCCAGTFTSLAGAQETINWADISAPVTGEGSIRAVALANTMRLNNITVYAIGLGDGNAATVQPFLCQIANDPCSSTYNPAQPIGQMVWAPNAAALDQAFQAVASTIRLKLTQ